MQPADTLPTYRISSIGLPGDRPRKYRGSFQIRDDHTEQVLATCHLVGSAALDVQSITDAKHGAWFLTPNRKVLPTRWSVSNPTGAVLLQFDASLAGKLVNPAHRVSLVVQDAAGGEVGRLVDGRESALDRMVGASPARWLLVCQDTLLARVVSLPRPSAHRPGLLGKLSVFLAGSDRGFVSMGSDHVLPAPAVLAMLLLHEELTRPT